jgi:hypothetical protein
MALWRSIDPGTEDSGDREVTPAPAAPCAQAVAARAPRKGAAKTRPEDSRREQALGRRNQIGDLLKREGKARIVPAMFGIMPKAGCNCCSAGFERSGADSTVCTEK